MKHNNWQLGIEQQPRLIGQQPKLTKKNHAESVKIKVKVKKNKR